MVVTLMSATMFAGMATVVAEDQEQMEIPDIENFPEPPEKPVNPSFIGGPDRKVNSGKSAPNVNIIGNIVCTTKPVWFRGYTEKFYVSLSNEEYQQKTVEVDWYLWDSDTQEYEWYADASLIVSARSTANTDPDDAALTWPGMFNWICAKAYCDGYLVDTQENRFPW